MTKEKKFTKNSILFLRRCRKRDMERVEICGADFKVMFRATHEVVGIIC